MHLLLAQKGTIDEGGEAVDLGQSPADIVFLSAADTEIASLAGAAGRLGDGAPTLRLANVLRLKHPMSVDVYVERTLRHAKLVVLRLLGGRAYWPYGLDALRAATQGSGTRLCVLPGDDKPDAGLSAYSTLPPETCDRLFRYLAEGGAQNAENFLRAARAVIEGGEMPEDARPLLKAGRLDIANRARTGSRLSDDRPKASVVFYRALVQSGQTGAIEALCRALEDAGLDAEAVFVSSLKDPVSIETVRTLFARNPPDIVVNLTGFAVSSPSGTRTPTVLEEGGAVVLQAVLASGAREAWISSSQGLSARDLAMSVALPEVDGRVLSRAIAFKTAGEWDANTETDIVAHKPVADRIRHVADLAARWARLRNKANGGKTVAIVLANYPNRDGRLGNGVGLDTPAGTIEVLKAMAAAGYRVGDIPRDGNALIDHLMAGPTNAGTTARDIRETLSLDDYQAFFKTLPDGVRARVGERWGAPESDPFVLKHGGQTVFALPLARFGQTLIGVQPARGYNIDPKETYHSPDLVPPHNYFAFYAYLRTKAGIDAIVHMGKHGNLEWLPGKALALSEDCFPEAVLGAIPHLYPFIVNDPGEGTQAKRRTSAVIVDHLTPPLTRAETYGDLKDLEVLVDEYYEASGSDPRRLVLLRPRILDLVRDIGVDHDAGIGAGDGDDAALEKLDAYLCDLKEMQIRDGLHIFGKAPEGRLLTDLTVALARLPRGSRPGDGSLHRAIAADLLSGGEIGFDPLDCAMAEPWQGPRPACLRDLLDDPWRTKGDTVERIEILAGELVSERRQPGTDMAATALVLAEIRARIMPSVTACGNAEIDGILTGLAGRFLEPGPSGAPTRGRPDVLPTGRNFFSVDTRAVPTEAAYELGRRSAELLVTRHLQDHGEYPASIGLTAWGTSNMRTGGDDIAQALALIGVAPEWDRASRRVTGFRIRTQAELGRPRVDVTLRISGFFRDAFPDQIALFDSAVRAVAALDEDADDNPIAARVAAETGDLVAAGASREDALRRASFRVYGSRPGAYGAGLQALIDEKGWDSAADLAASYLTWGAYAYGRDGEGMPEREGFERRIGGIDAVVQNQDNREHDLLDSDDYYQFEGGMTAAAEHLSGKRPAIYHNDHSRPERPVIRALDEEIGRVVRARVVNPKWIAGVMRHGYKGAFEMAATVDYMFAFAATTGAVKDHHFDAVYRAFVLDDEVRRFMEDNNVHAFEDMADRMMEAIDRGLWKPRSNSARAELGAIAARHRPAAAVSSVPSGAEADPHGRD
ncbi:cobaltochelatase subunit CobN [Fulvimarina sp. 2208YS6-2-32]|uniref:Cobaltochelatase subunit CobN n=1 Tax=Fulvimarina uroteuthidis TaxID=3098149 RepID=A0ABU5HXX4_9HYPH|nr:cobaltochelatase subunit CobN [Fulvimarina sp. 2208YS6-2-32]MDY8107727.1 cobaltochelatase subunit CobN [Fulvimarina sp. 2208YS6-2-32]